MRPLSRVTAALVLGSIAGLTGGALPQTREPASLLYTVTENYEPSAWMGGEERFPRGAQIMRREGGKAELLVPGFSATADPEVSFDAARVLFSGKKLRGDHWAVWEINLASGEVRRVTPNSSDDYFRPFYLPESKIAYAHGHERHVSIEAMPLDGGKPLPLTYGLGNYLPSDVLHDGRILFSVSYSKDSTSEIFTVYPDGSGVESYRCDHGKSRQLGRQLRSGDIVFAEQNGVARFTSALAHEVTVRAPAVEYAGDIAESSSGDWLVSWRPHSGKHFTIARFTPDTGRVIPVVAVKDQDAVQPVLLQPRTIPNRFPSALHDRSYANLLCLNAYTSKDRFPVGSIVGVKVYTRDQQGSPRLLGSAPVESDGSFYVQVPGDQPLQFELLDSGGTTLKREEHGFWMRNGEQRICVGCHAGPETAPENAVPAVLLKSTVPADLTGAAKSPEGGH